MSKLADIFNNPAFSTAEMTEAINVIPAQYGDINQLGIFKEKGVTTTSVLIERKNNVLNVLSSVERESPGTPNTSGKRDVVSVPIPSFILDDSIKASDVQNIRKFGTADELEAIQDVVNNKLAEMKAKHEITLEYMRAGALQGIIKDGEGNVLANLFETFGVTQNTQDFKTSSASTNIGTLLHNVKRTIQKNLKGEVMNGVLCLCSGSFFDAITTHASVKEAYNAYQGASPLREDMRYDFEFQGIKFREYEGFASNSKGQTLRFIPENQAIFIPMGTLNTFETVFAPADYIEAANTVGQPYYAKQDIQKFERGIDVQTQSHPLPICKRPELLIKATLS